MAELIGLAEKNNIPVNEFLNILTAMPTCSPAGKGAAQSFLTRDFALLFPLELMIKGLGYLAAVAANEKVAAPVSDAAHRVFAKANSEGLGAKNMTVAMLLYK